MGSYYYLKPNGKKVLHVYKEIKFGIMANESNFKKATGPRIHRIYDTLVMMGW